jgi:lysophospholipase L1-like esterase
VDGENRHNSMGFRGEDVPVAKAPGEFRIACLGASTTYTIMVRDHRQSYPAVLQDLLRERGYSNVTVVNAGIPAWSSYETLINYLLRVQDLAPDLIVVNQGFADVAARFVWPPEAFKGDNSGYFAPQFADPAPALYEVSALLRILLVSSGRAMPASTMGRSVYNTATTAYYMEFSKQRFQFRWPSGIFKQVLLTDMFAANPPTYFRRNTENLVINARERGVQAVLVTFAYSPRFRGYFGVEGVQAAVDEHNGILGELASAHNVPFMDLKSILPEEEEYWGFDGIHLNEKGAALKAQLVADFLLDQGLLPQ